MNEHAASSLPSNRHLLSKLSRYEALFELAEVINAANTIESVGGVVASKLKYIADVYCWRYICIAGDSGEMDDPERTAIVIDGFRGSADVARTSPELLSSLETNLWRDRKTRFLSGPSMRPRPPRATVVEAPVIGLTPQKTRTTVIHPSPLWFDSAARHVHALQ